MNRLHLKKIFSRASFLSRFYRDRNVVLTYLSGGDRPGIQTLYPIRKSPMILLSMPGRKSPGTASGSEAIRSLKSQQKMDKFTKN